MDIGDTYDSYHESEELESQLPCQRQLPADLPTSLEDRRAPINYVGETEMYDGWQGAKNGSAMPLLY